MGGDGKVALTCILCLGYGNYHVKSHLAIHLTSINIFMDLTIKCFKKCYKKKIFTLEQKYSFLVSGIFKSEKVELIYCELTNKF